MSEGFFIGKGNKTTCGGEVLDGDPRVNILGLLHACAGDRVTCGVDGKTYRIVGGISHIESHGRLVAGTLDSRSDCPCNARLIPTELTARYRNESAAPQVGRRMAEAAHSTLTSPTVLPRQSAFSGNSVPPVFNSLELQEPGFYVAPQSMTRQALEALLFPERNLTVLSKFWALNPDLNDVKAGSMIVLSDPKNTSCTYQEAQLMEAAQQVKASLDGLTPEEADFRFRYGAEIASYIGSTSGATWLGVSAVVMETHLSNLRDTLQGMERLHQESYRQHGHLKSPQFFADRKRLMAQLNAHLLNSTRLRGQTSLGDHPKLKTALGISSRSLVHHWDKAGGPGQIPGYATHVEATSRAAKYMKAGGYIAIGISGVSSLVAIEEVCSGDSGAACEKIKFTEGGKFGLSTIFGAASGWVSSIAGGPICVALGASTGIGGVVCVAAIVGAGAWAGTTVGEKVGEHMGEKVYEAIQP
ncbi:PAAR domain-containing protein [Pseudomonas yamanorum]|uniref:PAAR domain-containing protein n=1 Tax=Pseudomonas yamanorum TaxID=515393 RepID=A0A7Y8FFD0_9PSED|nr:PAAR domain-containing protein [Pseudomonas yamanorum]NWE78079.1 PAAR domain-containing protein [Pseudomonas yamanorum]